MKNPKFPDTRAVGMFFREKEGIPAFLWAEEIPIGASVDFEREPENPHDPNAIKVLHNGLHVAFIERGQAAFISAYLDDGVPYFAEVTGEAYERDHRVPLITFFPIDAKEEPVNRDMTKEEEDKFFNSPDNSQVSAG